MNIFFKYALKKVYDARTKYFNGITIRNYEVLAPHRQLQLAFLIVKTVRLITLLIVLYLTFRY